MRAGQLRERVQILYAAKVKNTYGEAVQDWDNPTLTATVWGQLQPLMAQAREAFAVTGQQLQAKVPYQCRLRYGQALSAVTNRLRVDGRTFEITGFADPEGRERELVVFCYEVLA